MVPLSDAIYLSISPIPGDDLRSNCPRPVPGNKISELRVYGFIRFNSTRSRWISIDQIVLFSTFALTNWGRRYFQENTGSLKISSLNRNDTPVYIYIYIGTLLSRVAYPHIDIGLIESYPRGTSCRGDTCRSFIKDRQNKSRVKGLLVPYGTIELPQLAPSSTATIFSSTRIHGVYLQCVPARLL